MAFGGNSAARFGRLGSGPALSPCPRLAVAGDRVGPGLGLLYGCDYGLGGYPSPGPPVRACPTLGFHSPCGYPSLGAPSPNLVGSGGITQVLCGYPPHAWTLEGNEIE